MSIQDIVDVVFAAVSPDDREWLVTKLRNSGMGEDELRQILIENGHPDYVPGGDHYRPPGRLH